MIRPRVGLITIANPFEEGAGTAPEIAENGLAILKGSSLEVIPAQEIIKDDASALRVAEELRDSRIDIICLVVVTWSEDHLVLHILEKIRVPVAVWALPGINTGSLCGAQQLCCVLKELGHPYEFLYGDISGQAVQAKLAAYAQIVALRNNLRLTRFGLIGTHVKGMTEVAFDELELKSCFGCSVLYAGVQDLQEWTKAVANDKSVHVWNSIKQRLGKIYVCDEEGISASRIYLALKRFVDLEGLAGLAVQCYPAFMGKVCLAFSLLADEGIMGGCEGDMNSTLAMHIIHQLTGEAVHNTDLLAVNEREGTLVLSHCGSGGFSLASQPEDISLAPVRLVQQGVCVLFPGRPGPVTMVNLVGRRGTYRMCVIEGEAVPAEMVFPGNPVKVRIQVDVAKLLKGIAENGFGHHWMIGYGQVGEELARLGKLLGIAHSKY